MAGILRVAPWEGRVTLDDGQVIPITNWLAGKDEVSGPEIAGSFVAGPDADGVWYAAELSEDDFDD
jgi:hypothetical protein